MSDFAAMWMDPDTSVPPYRAAKVYALRVDAAFSLYERGLIGAPCVVVQVGCAAGWHAPFDEYIPVRWMSGLADPERLLGKRMQPPAL